MFSKKQKPAWPQKLPSAIVTVQNKLTIVYVKYLQSKVHLFKSDHPRWRFGKKHFISKTGLMFFNPPPPPSKPTNLWKAIYRSFQNHWDAFGLNTFQFFSFSHQSWWKIISRNTIPDMKRYLFAMKFIFKHIFGHFFENEWKGQNTIQSRPQEKKYVFILRKFKCSIFLYQQYYASSNVSTISQPPDSVCCYFFPVVVNFYVKPIGPLLSPLFLQKSNSIDFQDRQPTSLSDVGLW